MKRLLLLAIVVCGLWPGREVQAQPAAAPAMKTLRLAFPIAESGFDPARIGDAYSNAIALHIFEGLYAYDHLARPIQIRPLAALALPEVSADFRTWTIRLRSDRRFTDDPAFKGVPRPLVAQDYVYSIKRYVDPAVRSPNSNSVEQIGITGLAALRARALKTGQPFDYDQPIEGLRALDRHTLQIRLDAPRPRLLQTLTYFYTAAVAREVVEHYGERIAEHPVGTGPFRLHGWRRSSQIVLQRNPQYPVVHYDAQPAADDAEGQALLARFRGRPLPLVDRVEIAIIEANQPRWLTFLDGSLDHVELPTDFIDRAMPNRTLAPYLAQQGIRGHLSVTQTVSFTWFNMEHPLVGGYTSEKVALRRAIGLAMDVERQIRLMRGGQALQAHSPVAVHMSGYDPGFRSEMGEYDPVRARALLDLYGYVDRDGDGWREQPDGRALLLEIATETGEVSRGYNELTRRDLDAIGLRAVFKANQWQENSRAARAGRLMMWAQGYGAVSPDGQGAFERLYGPAAGGANSSRFNLPAMDALYGQLQALPDGPQRDAVFDQAKRLAVAFMPEKTMVHRMFTDMTQPWMEGFRRPVFGGYWYHMVDIDTARQSQR